MSEMVLCKDNIGGIIFVLPLVNYTLSTCTGLMVLTVTAGLFG